MIRNVHDLNYANFIFQILTHCGIITYYIYLYIFLNVFCRLIIYSFQPRWSERIQTFMTPFVGELYLVTLIMLSDHRSTQCNTIRPNLVFNKIIAFLYEIYDSVQPVELAMEKSKIVSGQIGGVVKETIHAVIEKKSRLYWF